MRFIALIALLCAVLNPSFESAQTSKSAPSQGKKSSSAEQKSRLTVQADVAGTLLLDGVELGRLESDQVQSFSIPRGEHIAEFIPASAPKVKWSQVISVKEESKVLQISVQAKVSEEETSEKAEMIPADQRQLTGTWSSSNTDQIVGGECSKTTILKLYVVLQDNVESRAFLRADVNANCANIGPMRIVIEYQGQVLRQYEDSFKASMPKTGCEGDCSGWESIITAPLKMSKEGTTLTFDGNTYTKISNGIPQSVAAEKLGMKVVGK
jgi:hypothetical protein